MPIQGPNSPGTLSNVSRGAPYDNEWTNASNASSSNDSRASVSLPAYAESEYLTASNFGFSIPAGATINGISVEVEGYGTGTPYLWYAGLMKTSSSDNFGYGAIPYGYVSLPTSESYATLGGNTRLWGTTWSPSEINASTFGVKVVATSNDAAGINVFCDHIRITVDYTLPSQPGLRQSQIQPLLAQ